MIYPMYAIIATTVKEEPVTETGHCFWGWGRWEQFYEQTQHSASTSAPWRHLLFWVGQMKHGATLQRWKMGYFLKGGWGRDT